MKHKTWQYAISALLPMLSLLIFSIAVNVEDPQATGFAVLVPKPIEQINAKFNVIIAEGEFIPLGSVVQVRYGEQISSLPLKELLQKQTSSPVITINRNPILNYVGQGIQGHYTVEFTLSDFTLNQEFTKNPLEITLLYNTQVISKITAKLNEE